MQKSRVEEQELKEQLFLKIFDFQKSFSHINHSIQTGDIKILYD